jgi:hypothetical protein
MEWTLTQHEIQPEGRKFVVAELLVEDDRGSKFAHSMFIDGTTDDVRKNFPFLVNAKEA